MDLTFVLFHRGRFVVSSLLICFLSMRKGEDSELHKSMESFKVQNFTGGASGAFMYYSADKRFIVKQIDHKEMSRMLKMLDDYS